jgi:thiamine-phosphate diphosphorylase
MIQLRDKELPDGEFYGQAEKLRELTRQAGILFIVNDRLDVAVAVSADGVHLGDHDLPLNVARRLVGSEMLLGASARTPTEVCSAQQAGADYLGVGAIFPTGTKSDAACVGLERIVQLRPLAKIPILAIGGITAQNAAQAIRAGADGVAVVSSAVGADDVARATAAILEQVSRAQGEMG